MLRVVEQLQYFARVRRFAANRGRFARGITQRTPVRGEVCLGVGLK